MPDQTNAPGGLPQAGRMRWKPWTGIEDCEACGSELEVFTSEDEAGRFWDGDEVRCVDPSCDHKGSVSADGEGAHIVWPEE